MRISAIIAELKSLKKEHGDIEVTCTGSMLQDGFSMANVNFVRSHGREPKHPLPADVFETTVENFEVHEHPTIGKCVRVHL